MKKQRLLKAADVLEADAANPKGAKFDLNTWGVCDEDATMSLSCGTQACALGVIALSGAFKRAGLTWHTEPSGFRENSLDLVIEYQPRGGGQSIDGSDAAASLFGISDDEAYWLFMPDHYPESQRTGRRGELAVAKRLRQLAADTVALNIHADGRIVAHRRAA